VLANSTLLGPEVAQLRSLAKGGIRKMMDEDYFQTKGIQEEICELAEREERGFRGKNNTSPAIEEGSATVRAFLCFRVKAPRHAEPTGT
jgi:hypothetical protein